MANEEQLTILKQGTEAWNTWRNANPGVQVELSMARLSGANLIRADLHGARLSGAHLHRARLGGADLSRADLSNADLIRADLVGANLSGAHLSLADFRRADLMGADFLGAELRWVDLSWAQLDEADFSRAEFEGTILANVDLSRVRGLDTVWHVGPSSIGIDTFFRSQGKMPEVFLRGCGVPDSFLAYAASLGGKPAPFYSCFISYSSQDQVFADRLHDDLQARAVRVWGSAENLKSGDALRSRLDREIGLYDKLLLILSETSVQSEWVREEIEVAAAKEHVEKRPVLFLVRLDDAVLKTDQPWAAKLRRQRHIGDMSQWKDPEAYQKEFDRLLRDLQAEPVMPK